MCGIFFKFCVELRTSFVLMALTCCNINVVLKWLVEDARSVICNCPVHSTSDISQAAQ